LLKSQAHELQNFSQTPRSIADKYRSGLPILPPAWCTMELSRKSTTSNPAKLPILGKNSRNLNLSKKLPPIHFCQIFAIIEFKSYQTK